MKFTKIYLVISFFSFVFAQEVLETLDSSSITSSDSVEVSGVNTKFSWLLLNLLASIAGLATTCIPGPVKKRDEFNDVSNNTDIIVGSENVLNVASKAACFLTVASTISTSASLLIAMYQAILDKKPDKGCQFKEFFHNLGFEYEIDGTVDNNEDSSIRTLPWDAYKKTPGFKLFKNFNLKVALQVDKVFDDKNDDSQGYSDFCFTVSSLSPTSLFADLDGKYVFETCVTKNIIYQISDSKYNSLPGKIVSKIYHRLKSKNFSLINPSRLINDVNGFLGDKTEEFLTKTKNLLQFVEDGVANNGECKRGDFVINNKQNKKLLSMKVSKC
ncbi:uncharacterized protein SCDLUD_002494 [Saccharomycodes ludwigii]|uniref:uncharacterized protein n=1 Tax=Saccharomycodes ludwigii TaxID=36035 RepID=UPI001E840761|nr:hypothetical protein SCDLUD_002494 [Saccharomycodes ludwigii]KAH3901026.1 hypothetical protein SCDLUD_002494 [Saccharomycodes ludwigii]